MYFANDKHGLRTYIDEAKIGGEYTCPICGCKMIQRRGEVVAHHFAHKSRSSCDAWYSGKISAWHKEMQSLFPESRREVTIWNFEHTEYHIADAVFNVGKKPCVVEFQHSTISYNDFIARTTFYIGCGYRILWIFDFRDSRSLKKIYYTELSDSNYIRVIWPGKDRIKFLDHVDFSEYSRNLYIYFHVSTGKGETHCIESSDYPDYEVWEYIDPFNREQLFIELYLPQFYSSKEFFARRFDEEEFRKMLKNAGKCQNHH